MSVSVRVVWRVAVVVLLSALVLAAAGWWLAAAGLMWPLGWLAGRWSSRAEAAVLHAELDRSRTRIDRLEDQLTFWPPSPAAGRPDWSARNRNSNTASRDASPSHTTPV
ncbi:hypothetical protein [Micromonospora sp. NBC_00421]|uniref:hypothetical protein n=1 Tax=Micromonospora sp. NBC_00421 TaxID=2975976 RepID=UPI002E219852